MKQLLITQTQNGICVEDTLSRDGDTLRISINLPAKDYRLAELQVDIWERAARYAEEWAQAVRAAVPAQQ